MLLFNKKAICEQTYSTIPIRFVSLTVTTKKKEAGNAVHTLSRYI